MNWLGASELAPTLSSRHDVSNSKQKSVVNNTGWKNEICFALPIGSPVCSSFPSQIHLAATSIITVWWWFKPDSAFTLTIEVSAVLPAPRKHTPMHFKRTTSAGDAASGRLNSLQVTIKSEKTAP